MRKATFGFCVFLAILFLVAPAMAQTYDVTNYMMLTPGQWKTIQGEDDCEGFTWNEAAVISSSGQYILETWYEQDGGWVKEGIGIFQVTPSNLLYHGEFDLSPGEEGLWLLNPPITVPRSLELNEPAISSGVVTGGGESGPYVFTFMILEAGVSVTTPAGVFNNCLKIVTSEMSMDGGQSEIMIWAPALGDVKSWSGEVEEGDLGVEIDADTYQATGYGSF